MGLLSTGDRGSSGILPIHTPSELTSEMAASRQHQSGRYSSAGGQQSVTARVRWRFKRRGVEGRVKVGITKLWWEVITLVWKVAAAAVS